ncbi:hypothetical protein F4805DRAFT_451655 [Annulohypoxylon moriforme]|nr:hypothetical protein F4805DRAFT_451655 [Annulohypoxylon moriforme]
MRLVSPTLLCRATYAYSSIWDSFAWISLIAIRGIEAVRFRNSHANSYNPRALVLNHAGTCPPTRNSCLSTLIYSSCCFYAVCSNKSGPRPARGRDTNT